MYHLLVRYGGWPGGSEIVGRDRIYISESAMHDRAFYKKTGTDLDIGKVSSIPALFATEINGSGPQVARIGHITGLTRSGNGYLVSYVFDSAFAPIPLDDLALFAVQLGTNQRMLTHSHWALKDVDLFKVLLMQKQKPSNAPTVFSIEAINKIEDDLVGVMMPFDSSFRYVYASLKIAVVAAGMRCLRADDIWQHSTVIQDVVSLIAKSRFVICDLTGRNPNVFYEAGIAHTLGKEIILITQADSDIPFDLKHIRYQRYLNNSEGRAKLRKDIEARLRTLLSA